MSMAFVVMYGYVWICVVMCGYVGLVWTYANMCMAFVVMCDFLWRV